MEIVFVNDEDFMPETQPNTVYVFQNSRGRMATVTVDASGSWSGIHPLPDGFRTEEEVRAYFFRKKLEESI